MSKVEESKETRFVVSVDELVARATELKDQIEAITATLNTYLNQYRELQLAQETLKNLPPSASQGYVMLDRLSMVFIPTKIDEEWANNVLVNLGLGYYIKTTKEKAIEILQRRIQEVERIISSIQTHQQRLVKEYVAIQRVLSQTLEARSVEEAK